MNITVPTSVGMPSEVRINSPHMICAKEKPEVAAGSKAYCNAVITKEQYLSDAAP